MIFARFRSSPYPFLLTAFLATGAFIRIKGLTFQSFWLDELHTGIEADPGNSLSTVLNYLRTVDPQPPLYHLLVHFWMKIAGYNDFQARLIPAMAGVAGIAAIYFLGKAIYDRQAGIIAALFTCFNYFHLYYSQEARNYTLLFLLTCLSFLYLIRCLKNFSRNSQALYILCTVLLLYTHYYALAVVGSQAVLFFIFLFTDSNPKRYCIRHGLSELIILLLYLPWIGFLISINKVYDGNLWIPRPEQNFVFQYFSQYFSDQLLQYTVVLLMLFFLFNIFSTPTGEHPFLQTRNGFIFTILFTWIILSYAIPYVRSLLNTPILWTRYTIITLPAILLIASIGIAMIQRNFIKIYLSFFIIMVSVVQLFIQQEYYTKPTKQQWREMAQAVARHQRPDVPFVSDRAWYNGYYLRQNHIIPRFIHLQKDSLRNRQYDSFWVITGQGGKPIANSLQPVLDSTMLIIDEFKGIDTWAKLYINKPPTTLQLTGDIIGDAKVLWGNGYIKAQSVLLKRGKYKLLINAWGTKAGEIYPAVKIFIDNKLVGTINIKSDFSDIYTLPFEVTEEKPILVDIEFVNDTAILDESGKIKEDRNLFVRAVMITKPITDKMPRDN
jgi:mannosyltransferase